MADNYLERKFEEYRENKGKAFRTRHLSSGGVKPGFLQVKYPLRRVFVTGGASGIGKAIVAEFRKADCRVAFCDVDSKKGRQTAEDTGARFYPADVSNADELEVCMGRILQSWGDIDVIVNNAGIGKFESLLTASVEDFDKVIATNLRPAFITSRLLAQHRHSQSEKNTFGRVINICSTRYLMSEPGTEAYSASKGGIYSLTHALAISLADLHITVNCISPGWIENGDYNALREEEHRQHPSQRVGRPGDIARMCIFLCQEENDFINGENIVIDGGMTKKMMYI